MPAISRYTKFSRINKSIHYNVTYSNQDEILTFHWMPQLSEIQVGHRNNDNEVENLACDHICFSQQTCVFQIKCQKGQPKPSSRYLPEHLEKEIQNFNKMNS